MARKDPDADREYRKKYHQTPQYKEWHRKWAKEWRKNNSERYKEIYKKSYQKNKGKRRNKINEYLRKYQKRRREEAILKYGGKCNCCGETIMGFLTIDHVNNDGNEHRKVVKSSRQLYYQLATRPISDRFQVLCWNCNLARAKTKDKICPHKM